MNWGPNAIPLAGGSASSNGDAPFGYQDPAGVDRAQPRASKFRDFLDGQSSTILMSETIRARKAFHLDNRGDILNDDDGAYQFSTVLHPNSAIPDQMVCVNVSDPAMPCTNSVTNILAAARSRHIGGGVVVGMGDGAVRFISENIDLDTWRAISTMDGREDPGQY
ncbi:MAG: hypothetical protein CMJ78_05550 [Planctomycetaceae bacterium]|nr:hypothetical protein [Planctomycetaceae bacterium]